MADEQQQTPRRRFPWSYLFSFLLIVGIIVTVVVLLFGRNTTKTFTKDEFITALGNNRVSEIYETPKEGTLVNIEGYYSPKDATKPTKKKFKVNFSYYEYYEELREWTYIDDASGKKCYLLGNLPVETESLDPHTLILSDFLYEKSVTASTAENPTFILHSANDPYVVSWWDQWGPTIIMLGGSLLICVFLFFRLSGTVNGANNKALEFNKSRARRMTNSKTKFDDVAGAEEEKLEMAELVSYLKEPKKFAKFGAKLPKGVLLVAL